jgi:hypothetical protein
MGVEVKGENDGFWMMDFESGGAVICEEPAIHNSKFII